MIPAMSATLIPVKWSLGISRPERALRLVRVGSLSLLNFVTKKLFGNQQARKGIKTVKPFNFFPLRSVITGGLGISRPERALRRRRILEPFFLDFCSPFGNQQARKGINPGNSKIPVLKQPGFHASGI